MTDTTKQPEGERDNLEWLAEHLTPTNPIVLSHKQAELLRCAARFFADAGYNEGATPETDARFFEACNKIVSPVRTQSPREITGSLWDFCRGLERSRNGILREVERLRYLAAIGGDVLLDVREDAARYQWLREHSFVTHERADSVINFGLGYQQTKPELLDAAIDAARGSKP